VGGAQGHPRFQADAEKSAETQSASRVRDATDDRQSPQRGIGSPLETADPDGFAFARALVETRRLVDPGSSPQQLETLLSLAAAAPDHGLPMPWRLMIVPASQRQALAEVQAMGQRNLCHRGARLPTLIQYAAA
jgi:hypothetical protein